jgi:hypothetical protein
MMIPPVGTGVLSDTADGTRIARWVCDTDQTERRPPLGALVALAAMQFTARCDAGERQIQRQVPTHFHDLLLFKFAKGSHDPNGPRPHPAQDFSQLVEK